MPQITGLTLIATPGRPLGPFTARVPGAAALTPFKPITHDQFAPGAQTQGEFMPGAVTAQAK